MILAVVLLFPVGAEDLLFVGREILSFYKQHLASYMLSNIRIK